MCSPELRKKSQKKLKNKKNIEHDISPICRGGGPCWADCSNFLHVGWHPRRNHAYQILSRSRQGLLSYGGPKLGFSYAFLNRSYNSVTHYRATLWLGLRTPVAKIVNAPFNTINLSNNNWIGNVWFIYCFRLVVYWNTFNSSYTATKIALNLCMQKSVYTILADYHSVAR